MTATLKIATLDNATYTDLLAGTLRLEADSWTTRSAAMVGAYTHEPYGAQAAFDHYAPVVETFDLVGKDTGANLTAAIAALGSLLTGARLWHTSNHRMQSYWLHHCAAGETATRRALIYEASFQILHADGLDPMLEEAAVRLRLTITRHPLWEPITSATQTTTNHVLWGSKWTVASVPGNEPARIRDLQVRPRSGGGGPLYRLWIGLREQSTGTANFDPVWELEDGTNEATATDVPDATTTTSSATGSSRQPSPRTSWRTSWSTWPSSWRRGKLVGTGCLLPLQTTMSLPPDPSATTPPGSSRRA